MKKPFSFLLLIILFQIGITAQEITPEVIASSGDFSEGSSGSLSWTLGEIAVETFTSSEGTLTQGFQQPGYAIETLIESNGLNISIQIYPVPSADFITIKVEGYENNLSAVVYDLQGRIVLNQPIVSGENSIDLNHLLSSEYILNVVNKEEKLISSYKIVKY